MIEQEESLVMISTRGRYALRVMLEMAKLQERRNPAVEYFHSGIFFSIFGKETIEIPPKRSAEHPNRKTLKSLSDFSVSFDLVGVTGLEPTAS